jgi:2-polyprenyl-3-methyl-5-hydroxy-6-metoxy-1,4-benzoquinol methylase
MSEQSLASLSKEKEAARAQWNRTPCGSGRYLDEYEPDTLDYFDAVRRSRYQVTDTWIPRTVDFTTARGGRVLEIGFGMGSDLLSWAEGGAEVHGIDITEEHFRLATLNFALHGRTADLRLCDAAKIDFPDAHFDVVYSNGVLHHTPDTVRCIGEAWRVLKPGGRLILALYHRWSAYHLITLLLYRGILRGELRRLGYDGLLATIEYGADGIERKPLVNLYSRRQLRHILGDFGEVEICVRHFRGAQLPLGGHFMPRFLERLIEPWFGWYVVAVATK